MMIGQYIESRFKEKGMRPSHFAKALHTTPRNLYNIFNRDSVDSSLLYAISMLLEEDFFKFFSNKLREENPQVFAKESIGGVEKTKRRVMIEVELEEDEFNDLLKKTTR